MTITFATLLALAGPAHPMVVETGWGSDQTHVVRDKRKKRVAPTAPLPAAPSSAKNVSEASPPQQPPAKATGKGLDVRLLAAHNVERLRLGMKPLQWSAQLAVNASKWAAYLAQTGKFEHAQLGRDEPDQGENLWMGTRSSYEPEEMVDAWISEKSMFKAGKFPQISSTGNWSDVGHYTQLIWYRTTHVGCAVAANQNDEFLVCRYDPPGNWEGQSPLGR